MSVCGWLPIPRALQHFSSKTSICVHTRCVCIFWDVTLALQGMDRSSPIGSLPSHKSIWPCSALSCLVSLCFSKCWSVLSLSLSLIAPGFDRGRLFSILRGFPLSDVCFLSSCFVEKHPNWHSCELTKGALAWGSAVLCSIGLLSCSFTGCCLSLSSLPPSQLLGMKPHSLSCFIKITWVAAAGFLPCPPLCQWDASPRVRCSYHFLLELQGLGHLTHSLKRSFHRRTTVEAQVRAGFSTRLLRENSWPLCWHLQ